MIFRYYIYFNEADTVLHPVKPNYKDDIALETELENNQHFYRDKISGKMSFQSVVNQRDFELIMSQPFDTQYNLLMETSEDYGQTWEFEHLAKFFQTDCEIDFDDKMITVQPDPVDEYVDPLAAMDKEINLADFPIEIQSIHLQKRPLIQIYIPGDEIVSCFLSGMAWEQDVRESTTDVTLLTNSYHFAFTSVIRTMFIDVKGTPLDAGGNYTLKTTNAFPFVGDIIGDNGYKISVEAAPDPSNPGQYITAVAIIRISDNEGMFYGQLANTNGLYNEDFIALNAFSAEATGGAIGTFSTKPIYARYLLDVPNINGVATYPIPSDDLVDNNRNYHRAVGYAIDVIYTSENFSDEPTEWGKNSAGKYFLPPHSLFGDKFYPVARSQWEQVSFWFAFHIMDEFLEVKGRAPVLLRDSYPVSSVVSVFLKEFAPDIIHEATPEYSEFLYGDTNPIINRKFRLFISQKTNLLNIQYQNPAQKTPMTLQKITNMLRDCFRCFWYIEDGKFKVEHIKWFMNGGSYDETPLVSFDVTQMMNVRNGKDWAFSTSKITFDKMDMPERFQFKWMDDVSDSFEGMPIEVVSRYVMPGKIEDINISSFNSDVDYLLLNPSEIAQDGFVLMAAVDWEGFKPLDYGDYNFEANNGPSATFDIKPEFQGQQAKVKLTSELVSGSGTTYIFFYDSGGTAIPNIFPFVPGGEISVDVLVPLNAVSIGIYSIAHVTGRFITFSVPGQYELPFVTSALGSVNARLQNGYVAFSTLQPNFYVYDLPASQVKINGIQRGVETDRKRKQTLSFPVFGEFDPMELVNTHLGYGQIDKISLNLHSRMSKTTLKYDTE